MGNGIWQAPHMTRTAKSATESFNEIASIRIELVDSESLIWRQVEVPTSMTLKALHDVVQAVMGWFDYHLWEFTIADKRYGLPADEDWGTEPRYEAAKTRLRDVLAPGQAVIGYTYDFGDNWEHRLIVNNVRQGEPDGSYPRYIGGERNGPPEDCGGIPGFSDILDALADPNHPDHEEVVKFSDGYDPEEIDELLIKYALLRIARQRNGYKAQLAKKADGA